MIVKTSGKMRNHVKARERNGLMEGSLANSEMREFEEDRSRLAAFCSPQRNRNNDDIEDAKSTISQIA